MVAGGGGDEQRPVCGWQRSRQGLDCDCKFRFAFEIDDDELGLVLGSEAVMAAEIW
jgi:hypothetical protein